MNVDFFLLAPHLDMSDDEIVFDVTAEDGTVEQKRVQRDETELRVRFLFRFVVASRVARSPQLVRRQLVAVSDNIAHLTRVTKLEVRLFVVSFRALTPSPTAQRQRLHRDPGGRVGHDAADVLERESPSPIHSLLTRCLQLGGNRLVTIPPEIGRLRALKTLRVSRSFTAPRQD